ncbi:PBECR2 nuclease fold domain-containing protein [Helicobacter turcicus]|uniref:PBECR2 nuclease fold domain-containing protein n=1 Tax=Helicobacter turcicus TaxID=2867412 RepID=UPI001F3AB4A6|nr:PBECR2 nuclease fold domain-containing protein [Helicobacter turcicus]
MSEREAKDEVKEYLKSDIHLKIGSLLKIIKKDRIDIIDKIKPTLEEPNFVLDDNKGILFIKEFIDIDKNRYFMSVAKNYDGEWICSSHTKREFNNIKNKIQNSKIIYNKGFQGSEVASACDILESGGEVSKPSHLQIKYTANQDFGKNPSEIISQSKAHLKTYKITLQEDSTLTQQSHIIKESQMSNEEKLEIFQLGVALTQALNGDSEAIADLNRIYKRHKEMFKDEEDVKNLIEQVIANPEIVIDAQRNESYNVYKAIKAINDEKMGDVVVKDDGGINEIFHANKKKISELNRFKKHLDEKDNLVNLVGGGDAHSPHPTDKERVWATDTKVCSPTNDIIPQTQDSLKTYKIPLQEDSNFKDLSTKQKLELLAANQKAIAEAKSPKEIIQESTKDSKQLKASKDSNQESKINTFKHKGH